MFDNYEEVCYNCKHWVPNDGALDKGYCLLVKDSNIPKDATDFCISFVSLRGKLCRR